MISNREVKIHRPFGPYIMQTTISEELHNILLKNAKKIRKNKKLKLQNDYRNKLAGNLKEEYSYNGAFTNKEMSIIDDEFRWLASVFTKKSKEAIDSNFGLEPKDINILKPVWVNFMKAGEWNPAHNHTGDISCVTYLQVPPEIAQENNNSSASNKSNTPSAGKIEFSYGDSIPYSRGGLMFTPRERDIYFFSAKLRHFVYPFQSKKERISVSLNFSNIITAKNNLYGVGEQVMK